MPSYFTAMLAELRGVQQADSYVHKATGELRNVPASLKVERELPGGDVESYEVRLHEDVHLAVDLRQLERGDQLIVRGEVNGWPNGHFVRWNSVELAAEAPAGVLELLGAQPSPTA